MKRIVIIGSCGSGKTTPWPSLGHSFSDPPSLEDFEQQFELSNNLVLESDPNTLFDRSPLDFLAYALTLGEKTSIMKNCSLNSIKAFLSWISSFTSP